MNGLNYNRLKNVHFEGLGKHASEVQLNYVWHYVRGVIHVLFYIELYFLLNQLLP